MISQGFCSFVPSHFMPLPMRVLRWDIQMNLCNPLRQSPIWCCYRLDDASERDRRAEICMLYAQFLHTLMFRGDDQQIFHAFNISDMQNVSSAYSLVFPPVQVVFVPWIRLTLWHGSWPRCRRPWKVSSDSMVDSAPLTAQFGTVRCGFLDYPENIWRHQFTLFEGTWYPMQWTILKSQHISVDSDLSLVRTSSDFHRMIVPVALFFQEYRQRGVAEWCNSMNLKVRKLLCSVLPDQPTNPKKLFLLWRGSQSESPRFEKLLQTKCLHQKRWKKRYLLRHPLQRPQRWWKCFCEHIAMLLPATFMLSQNMPAWRRHILFIGHTTLGFSSESTWHVDAL